MNKQIRVLCFGDSNTWGYNPKDESRFSKDVRWTGLLQKSLGSNYEIIEEGLNGRTTAFDYKNRRGKNGGNYIIPCMDSHYPLDYVIVCLGTNDTKTEFNLSAEQIATGLENIVKIILGKNLERPSPNVKLIIASPVIVDEKYIGDYAEFIGAGAKTKQFPKLYKQIAEKHGAVFTDLAQVAEPSPVDGCHMDATNQTKIAKHFHQLILKLN